MDKSEKVYANKLWSFIAPSILRKSFIEPRRNTSVTFDSAGSLFFLNKEGRLSWKKQLDAEIIDAKIFNDGSNIAVLTGGGRILLFRDDGGLVKKIPVPMDACFLEVQAEGHLFFVAAGWTRCLIFSTLGRQTGELCARHQVVSVCMAQREGSLILADNYYKATYFAQVRGKYEGQWEVELKCTLGTPACNGAGDFILLPAFQNGAYAFDKSGNRLGTYSAGKMVTAAAMNEEGELLVFANSERQIVVMNRRGRILGVFEMGDEITSISLNSIGNRLLVVGAAGQLNCFELSQGKSGVAKYLELHPEEPREVLAKSPLWVKRISARVLRFGFGEVILSYEGRRICLFAGNRIIRFIENTGAFAPEALRVRGAQEGFTLTSDGKTVIFYSDNGIYKVDIYSGQCIFKERKYLSVKQCVASADGSAFIICDEFNDITIYDNDLEVRKRLTFEEEVDCIQCDFDSRIIYLVFDGSRAQSLNFDGKAIAGFAVGGAAITSLLLLEDCVILGSVTGELYAFEHGGGVLWRKAMAGGIAAMVKLDRNVIIYFSDGGLAVVDYGGNEVVKKRGALGHSRVFERQGDLLEAGYEDRHITVLDIRGAIVWRYLARDFVKSLSVSGDGNFIAALDAQNLYYFSTGREELESKPYRHLEF